jgi:hypothetical protein
MNFGIVLNESDLREMPPDLRDQLLKWYFDRSSSGVVSASPHMLDARPPVMAAVPRREERGRASFPDLVRAGLMSPGDELVCKTLKRQQRGGKDQFIEAGKVLANGGVEYGGQRYDIPSKLAVIVINANGGKTDAVNGYDYLFVRSPKGLVPLSKLRDELPRHAA